MLDINILTSYFFILVFVLNAFNFVIMKDSDLNLYEVYFYDSIISTLFTYK